MSSNVGVMCDTQRLPTHRIFERRRFVAEVGVGGESTYTPDSVPTLRSAMTIPLG
jgi:hypothetical protein